MPFINVTLHRPKVPVQDRKINDIKALRESTRLIEAPRPAPDAYGNNYVVGDCMGLTEAKAAIETMYADGEVTLRMTPERYGYFMVNRHDIHFKYDWQVKRSSFYFAAREPKVFQL